MTGTSDFDPLENIDLPSSGHVASWTLHLENLGKLREADLHIHPLTLLVGENNTGKTYLATVLYALMEELPRIFSSTPPATPPYEACARWVQAWFDRNNPTIHLTPSDCELFILWLNEAIAQNRKDLLARAFNHEMGGNAKLEIRALEPLEPLELSFHQFQQREDEDVESVIFLAGSGASTVEPARLDDGEVYDLVRFIATRLIGLGNKTAVYLPASRTGVVHLYREVTLRSHESRRIRQRTRTTLTPLTTPVLDFIELLLELNIKNESRFSDEALHLEEACLGGHLEAATLPVAQYFYRPSGAADALPMALSSAVVTELVPIILTLRHKLDLGLLILEEPEAHLHPKLQRVLARVIARLVRKGLRVCITTHSENFCQQINNFIKIGALPTPGASAQALGYDATDYLRSDEVVGYEFKNHGDHAVVEPLKRSPTGLQMPLFNNELLNLSNETIALQDMLDRAAGENQ
jgi:predicted ATPase